MMETPKKRKRRWGDRPDGQRVRSLEPMNQVAAYIMVDRNDSINLFADEVDIATAEKYVLAKRRSGLDSFGLMHVFIAAYVRGIAQRPAINRFISGQKIYSREVVEVMLVVKREMTAEAPETVISVEIPKSATATDVYHLINDAVVSSRKAQSDFDDLARVINYIPGLVKKFVVWLLKFLDYFGLLPRALLRLSPFHGSLFVTSMGSLGIPPIYHHLYNFGNVPVFLAFGAKEKRYELQRDGSVKEVRFVRYTFVLDERICDGYYYASMCRIFKNTLKNPSVLDEVPEVVEDIL